MAAALLLDEESREWFEALDLQGQYQLQWKVEHEGVSLQQLVLERRIDDEEYHNRRLWQEASRAQSEAYSSGNKLKRMRDQMAKLEPKTKETKRIRVFIRLNKGTA